MPGKTNTAGLAEAGWSLPRAMFPRMPRVPVADSPAYDSGPMVRQPAGCSCVSPLTTASAVRSLAK